VAFGGTRVVIAHACYAQRHGRRRKATCCNLRNFLNQDITRSYRAAPARDAPVPAVNSLFHFLMVSN
jgi:hypothetical protein